MDFESETFVAHSLRGEGFDASEDGTGRGTPIVPIDMRQASRGEKITNVRSSGSGGAPGVGVGEIGDPAFTVSERGQAVAYPMTLAIRGRNGEPDLEWRQDGTANAVLTPNGGRAGIGVGAIAIQAGALRENPESGPDGVGVQEGIAYTLEARQEVQAIQSAWAVRRLTPTECHRLQGFRDGFCNIPWRGKPESPDGPQYKALGNSMAVNVMRWIGRRIQMVEEIMAERDDAA
jgi:DNA (cytosine-5)-methyltransferase 1